MDHQLLYVYSISSELFSLNTFLQVLQVIFWKPVYELEVYLLWSKLNLVDFYSVYLGKYLGLLWIYNLEFLYSNQPKFIVMVFTIFFCSQIIIQIYSTSSALVYQIWYCNMIFVFMHLLISWSF